jgi:hypothetical protein
LRKVVGKHVHHASTKLFFLLGQVTTTYNADYSTRIYMCERVE